MFVIRHVVKPVLSCLLLAASMLTQADAAVPGFNSESIYRLNTNATYQEGCFEGCLCPISAELTVRGTFILGPVTPGDVVDFREVSQVNWTVHFDHNVVHTITGTGVYRITNFGPAPQHALDLDLAIDGGQPQHFFSDFVPVSSNDGTIDLPVSMNGLFCYDVLIRVNASPVPPDEITRYGLAPGSRYQIACFDPCDCVSQEPRPMRGHFQLVPLLDLGTYAEYAIVNSRFVARSPSIVDAIITLTGFGHYTLIQGFAGPAHAMDLLLVLNGGEPVLFDQELENTSALFPAIEAVVDTNEMVCTDTVLTIKARPWSVLRPALIR